MTYLDRTPTAGPHAVHHREGPGMLLMNEAMARSRQRQAEQAAREHALARQLVAGRRWAWLAGFAARRAERARAQVGEPVSG